MDKILTAIVEALTALKNDVTSPVAAAKSVFYGDPDSIPMSDCPAIIARPVRSSWVQGMSRYDRKEHEVEIVIVGNRKNYRESINANERKVLNLATMISMMEQTDTDQKTKITSIVGKMLSNTILPYTTDGSGVASIDIKATSIDYVFNASRGFPTFEIIGSFTVVSQGDRAY